MLLNMGEVGTGPGQENRQGCLEERGRFELLLAGAFHPGRETLRGPVCRRGVGRCRSGRRAENRLYEWKTLHNANCADPVIVGDAIFITSSYGRGCALIDVSGGNAAVRWKKGFECHYASPVLVGDCLYVLAGSGWMRADLVCVSAKDGSLRWREKDVGSGGLVVADGKLLILSRRGDLILAEASPAAYTEIGADEGVLQGDCWNGPVLSDGRVYVRNENGTLVCLDLRRK